MVTEGGMVPPRGEADALVRRRGGSRADARQADEGVRLSYRVRRRESTAVATNAATPRIPHTAIHAACAERIQFHIASVIAHSPYTKTNMRRWARSSSTPAAMLPARTSVGRMPRTMLKATIQSVIGA